MCLILVAWRTHPDYPCIIAANRDEFFERPSSVAHWWGEAPDILAGRDLEAGGTWLGVTRARRFVALTNYRGAPEQRTDAPSRGLLVGEMLRSEGPIEADLEHLRRKGGGYNAFNLMLADADRLGVYESVRGAGRLLGPGIYGLSNHMLDTPWPKVRDGKTRLQAALGDLEDLEDPTRMLELLRDDRPANDGELPRTGVDPAWERLLSSAFVRGDRYGTRCSTVIRMRRSGRVSFDEWTWDRSGAPSGKSSFEFQTAPASGGKQRRSYP